MILAAVVLVYQSIISGGNHWVGYGAGADKQMKPLEIYVQGDFVGTLQTECEVSDGNWIPVAGDYAPALNVKTVRTFRFTQPGVITINAPTCQTIRVRAVAWSNGVAGIRIYRSQQ